MERIDKDLRITKTIELALNWITKSDIRISSDQSLGRGGVCQGYDSQHRSYPFVYSEITGYAISTYINAFRWSGDECYLKLAHQAADFLIRVQKLSEDKYSFGGIPHSLSLPDLQPRHMYYSFDASMCLQGLLDLYTIKPAPEYLRSAKMVGDWLLLQMQQENGAFQSMYNAESDCWEHRSDDVFGEGGCLHAKHAIGLLKLSTATGDNRYREAATRVCNWVLGLQGEDGAFRTTERLRQIVSHSHCYATEGLLYAHYLLGDERYLEAARKGGLWLLKAQQDDGSIRIEYKRRWWRLGRRINEIFFPLKVTDATAQSIRIWLVLYYLSNEQRYLDACEKAKGFLKRMQCTSSLDRNAYGGFFFQLGHPVMFSWCTMFAIHAQYSLEHLSRDNGYRHMMEELF